MKIVFRRGVRANPQPPIPHPGSKPKSPIDFRQTPDSFFKRGPLNFPFVTFLRRNFCVRCCIFVAAAVTAGAQWLNISNGSPEPEAVLARDMLAAHNEVRARIDAPPLHWSVRLASYA